VGTDSAKIAATAAELLNNAAAYQQMANAINPFGDGQASERILSIAEKYLS
jgi:UDP-N-acetylglucosamine 2-epimerase (non-hydrolysing)